MSVPVVRVKAVTYKPLKAHCKRGHQYADPPLRDADGYRICTPCGHINAKKHRDSQPPQRRAEIWRKWHLKARFGLTLETYEELLASQGSACAICKSLSTKTRKGRLFPIDHDHDTGRVRGLLCNTCNVAIGMAGENASLLRAMADYLDRTKSAR